MNRAYDIIFNESQVNPTDLPHPNYLKTIINSEEIKNFISFNLKKKKEGKSNINQFYKNFFLNHLNNKEYGF